MPSAPVCPHVTASNNRQVSLHAGIGYILVRDKWVSYGWIMMNHLGCAAVDPQAEEKHRPRTLFRASATLDH